MNNHWRALVSIVGVFSMISCSHSHIDEVQNGCSIRVSEQVYNGNFDVMNIDHIGVINGVSRQKLYPVPDWEKVDNLVVIRDPVFFDQFKQAIIAAGRKKEPSPIIHIVGNVQILVSFKNGPGAYLFSTTRDHSLGITPMFESDAYGVTSEPLFALINDELGKTKQPAIHN